MKNNTKLIMETWRRFLKEGPEGIDPDGMVVDEEEEVNASDRSPVTDSQLAGDIETIDSMRDDEMYYGDPAHMGSQSLAPMLQMNDDDDDDDDSIDHSAIDYFDANNIPHDQFGNALDDDDSLEEPEGFTGSFDDQDEDFTDYDREMQRLRRK